MLNSYKDLRRWFPAVEPQDAAAPRGRTDPDLEQALSQGCGARFPHYIQETEPEPFEFPFAGEPTTRRAEFVGGWSDWVADDRDNGGAARDADLVQFPWDDDSDAGPRRRTRRPEAEPDADDRAEPEPPRPPDRTRRARADEPDTTTDAREHESVRGTSRARDARTPARRVDVAGDDADDPAGVDEREPARGSGRAGDRRAAVRRADVVSGDDADDPVAMDERESAGGKGGAREGRVAARRADAPEDEPDDPVEVDDREPARGSGRAGEGRVVVRRVDASEDEPDGSVGVDGREPARGSDRARDSRAAVRRADVVSGDDADGPAEVDEREPARNGDAAVRRVDGASDDEPDGPAERDEGEPIRGAGRAGGGRTAAPLADTAADDEADSTKERELVRSSGRARVSVVHRRDDEAEEPGEREAVAPGGRAAGGSPVFEADGDWRDEDPAPRGGPRGRGDRREGPSDPDADRSHQDTDRSPREPAERPARTGHFIKRGKRSGRAAAAREPRTAWLDENDDWPGMDDDDWLADDGDWSSRARPAEPARRGRLRLARSRRAADDASGGPGAAADARRAAARRPESSRTLREQARPGRLRTAVVLIVAILLLAAVGAFALYLLHHRGGADRAAFARPEASPVRLTGATTGTTLVCPTAWTGAALRGAEPGGTGSGPEAVMWFEHAYYVERSADRALEVTAPGAALPPAAVIQRGIDSVPPGTAYCVVVAPSGENRYSVEITEQRPGGAPATYDKQTVTTTVDGGRTLITGITAG